MVADPSSPTPGSSTQLTVTVSGNRGADRYAVPGAVVAVALTERPDAQARLSAATLTTDDTGSATTTLTLSAARGRHVVTATSAGVSARLVFDTLNGSSSSGGRPRHSAGVITTAFAPVVKPAYLFLAAGVFLLGGFLFPYRSRLSFSKRRPAAPSSAARGG